jgi:serine/threonine protein kinase
VVVEMASGRDPWSEKNWRTPAQAVAFIAGSGEIPRIPTERLSELALDFIHKALTRDPKQRPSAAQLLKHRWITGRAEDEDEDESGDSQRQHAVASPTPSITNSAQAQIDQMTAAVVEHNHHALPAGGAGAAAATAASAAAGGSSSSAMMKDLASATQHLDLRNVDTSHLNGAYDDDAPPPPPPPEEDDEDDGWHQHQANHAQRPSAAAAARPQFNNSISSVSLSSDNCGSQHYNASVGRLGCPSPGPAGDGNGGGRLFGGQSLFDSSGLSQSRFVPCGPPGSEDEDGGAHDGNSVMSSSADAFEPTQHPAAVAARAHPAPQLSQLSAFRI